MKSHLRLVEPIRELAGALVGLLIVVALVAASFGWVHGKLMLAGVTTSVWQSAGLWWACGVVCALAWPLRCYEGMRGHWKEEAPHLAMLSLTGPWALLFGFPL